MSPTELRPWPADPVSAWAQAVAAPAAKSRYGERPSIRPLEEIAADVRGQRVFVPAVALVFTVVGAILVGGLLVGVFPLSGRSTSAGVQWFAGVVLLIVGPALWLGHRQWRKYEERQGFPPARGVLCEIYPTSFHIGDGDGWCLTSVAIDARTPDEQVSRIATAFRIWLARLEADKEADSAARMRGTRGSGGASSTPSHLTRSSAPRPPVDTSSAGPPSVHGGRCCSTGENPRPRHTRCAMRS